MLIPVGMNFEAVASGAILKNVLCEQCGEEYVYVMERSGEGRTTAPLFIGVTSAEHGASEQARGNLARTLQADCDVVPCPACGRVQANMVHRSRKLHTQWTYQAAVTLLILSAVLFGIYLLFGEVLGPFPQLRPFSWIGRIARVLMGASLVGCIALLPLRLALARRHDPNEGDPTPRREWAQRRAMLRRDFEMAMKNEGKS